MARGSGRGGGRGGGNRGGGGRSQADMDNRANQMNPNNDAYWQSRGEDERPEDWKDRGVDDDWDDDDDD